MLIESNDEMGARVISLIYSHRLADIPTKSMKFLTFLLMWILTSVICLAINITRIIFWLYFQLDTDTGNIIIQAGTPAGIYTMDVIVSDGGAFPDVTSTTVVEVRDIPQEAVFSSGSIRFSGTTAEELISPVEGVSKLDDLKIILATAVGAKEENLDIFSVLNVPDTDMVDIRYAAHGSPFYPAVQLDLAALGVQDEVSFSNDFCVNFIDKTTHLYTLAYWWGGGLGGACPPPQKKKFNHGIQVICQWM